MQTMGEFASLTERLALMADPALQQFAQMHKDDPFTLALAVSESNRRRKMRTAQQGLAGMQQQAPVADQEIAQMSEPVMPETVGIGALPAPSMAGMPAGGIAGEEEMEPQAMAGGGMVAFAGGGDVERYQFGGMPASGGTEFAIPGMVQPSRSFMPQAGAPSATPFLRRKFDEMQEEGRRYQLAQAQARINMGVGTAADRALVTAYAEGSAPAATDVSARAATPTPTGAAPSLLAPSVVQPAGAPPGAAPDTVAPGAAAADTTQRQKPPAPGAAPGAAPATPSGGLGDLNTLYTNILAGQNYTDPAAAQLTALETKEREAAQAEKTALERDQAKFAEAFKGREARLGKREAEIGKQKDTNTGLAFLNAGLAIMSTPGGLATAIGKGAQVGTQQFAAGLDKIRSAQEKLDEARDRMEELKLNRDEMSAKEVRAAESKIRQVGIDAEKRGIDGLRQAAGVNRETAKTLFDKTVQVGATREEIASREKVAAMQAAASRANAQAGLQATLTSPERLAFAAALQSTITRDKPQGDPAEAYRKLMEIKREPMSVEQLRKDWNDMTKRLQISQDYPNVKTFEDYMTVMQAGGGGGGAGGGGFTIVGTRPAQ